MAPAAINLSNEERAAGAITFVHISGSYRAWVRKKREGVLQQRPFFTIMQRMHQGEKP